jgi:phosphoadenosine phosphosulfate reductase
MIKSSIGFETCQIKSKHVLNPIIDLSDEDVWEYLNSRGIPHCCLYDEGFSRVGCILCPMAGPNGMRREAERWPKYYAAYLRAIDKMLIARKVSGLNPIWPDAQTAMDWWISGKKMEADEDEAQISFWEDE